MIILTRWMSLVHWRSSITQNMTVQRIVSALDDTQCLQDSNSPCTGDVVILTSANTQPTAKGTPAFSTTIAAASQGVKSLQGVTLKADIDLDDALEDLDDYDVLVIPGGGTQPIL